MATTKLTTDTDHRSSSGNMFELWLRQKESLDVTARKASESFLRIGSLLETADNRLEPNTEPLLRKLLGQGKEEPRRSLSTTVEVVAKSKTESNVSSKRLIESVSRDSSSSKKVKPKERETTAKSNTEPNKQSKHESTSKKSKSNEQESRKAKLANNNQLQDTVFDYRYSSLCGNKNTSPNDEQSKKESSVKIVKKTNSNEVVGSKSVQKVHKKSSSSNTNNLKAELENKTPVEQQLSRMKSKFLEKSIICPNCDHTLQPYYCFLCNKNLLTKAYFKKHLFSEAHSRNVHKHVRLLELAAKMARFNSEETPSEAG